MRDFRYVLGVRVASMYRLRADSNETCRHGSAPADQSSLDACEVAEYFIRPVLKIVSDIVEVLSHQRSETLDVSLSVLAFSADFEQQLAGGIYGHGDLFPSETHKGRYSPSEATSTAPLNLNDNAESVRFCR